MAHATVSDYVRSLGLGAWEVGGAVRDSLLEREYKDTDFVVPGVGTRTQIRLARYGPQAGVRGATLLAGQELELGR